MTRYNKTFLSLIPLVLAGLKVLSDALGDGQVSTQEWVAVIVAALTSALVFAVPNVRPDGKAPDPHMSEQD